MIDIMKLAPADVQRFIHMQGIIDRQNAGAETIKALRAYYYGDHPVLLTQRQQEFIGKGLTEGEFAFAHNLVRSVVDTLRERIDVSGFVVNGEMADNDESPASIVAEMFWDWWSANRMPSRQIRAYRRALRDGRTYVMVDYDDEHNRPRYTLHHADDGNVGITYHRDPEDNNRTLFACRYFYTYDPLKPSSTGIERKTVYLPHEIRKYIRNRNSEWEPYQDDGDAAWPIPWVGVNGEPLGIAVHEFANPGGSEIAQIIGLQNALNKSWLDLLAAADSSGFPLMVAEYNDPIFSTGSDDDNIEGGDEFRIAPGRMIEIGAGSIKRIEPASLQPMIESIWAIVTAISGVSRTPQYYLRPFGGSEVPSGEALKQLESGIVKRAEERQLIFGDVWTDIMMQSYNVQRTFGGRASLPQFSEMDIQTSWADANVRNEELQARVASQHAALDVPDAQVWQLLGYTPAEIASFRDLMRSERAADIANIVAAVGVNDRRFDAQTQPQQFNGNGATNGAG